MNNTDAQWLLLESCLTICEDYRDTGVINGAATREELLETIRQLRIVLAESERAATLPSFQFAYERMKERLDS